MKILGLIFSWIVALEHIFILVLEMFLWESLGLKVFKMTPELAAQSKTLAMNQGLYNGFLAAGLIWGLLFISNKEWKVNVLNFFLSCVIVAGIFGGLTAKFSIIFTQGTPALIAILALNLLYKKD
ncbi:MAG: DUF1304 domain-containing protein [Leptospiraceae bacterium]|nr:DUF1304 domain-containing protein [Leptospiraceae bacterium]